MHRSHPSKDGGRVHGRKMADLFDLSRGGPLYSNGGPLTAAPYLTAGPHLGTL